ncbi:MAG: hypothetical protein AOA66_1601 [Candidatus Bathyarchaeota archaeon BA2]|nr:MAG: hypothetical protein AOA66_1601 [Candidatus Bathyarchaeota archaeon BA2]
MIRAENLIVEGKCFILSKVESKYIESLKKILTEFMTRKNMNQKVSEQYFFKIDSLR